MATLKDTMASGWPEGEGQGAHPGPRALQGLADVVQLLELLGYAEAGTWWPLQVLAALYALAHAVLDHPALRVRVGEAVLAPDPGSAPSVRLEAGGGLDPVVCLDGTVAADGRTLKLWARRRPFANHAAVNDVTCPGGLAIHGRLSGTDLELAFTFEGSDPVVVLETRTTLRDLARALVPVLPSASPGA